MPDVFSKAKRSEIMSKIRGRDTKPEKRFLELHPEAVPHPDWLPYHPDFLLDGRVHYIDSTFWHGFVPKKIHDKMKAKWQQKLFRNVLRDIIASVFYAEAGVLTRLLFWHGSLLETRNWWGNNQ